jgi:phosphodiesterase/alkaline phosphatase D-like protein
MAHGVATATLPALGCASEEAAAAVLEVDQQRALVSIWSGTESTAEVVLERSGRIVRAGHLATLGQRGTGVVRIEGLAPGRAYRAIVRTGGRDALERAFVTAPAVDDSRRVRMAVVADIDVRRYDTVLVDDLARTAPDLTVSLGDWPYADDSGAMCSAEEVLARYVDARGAAGLQAWLERTSLRAIYDDHEVQNNWCGGLELSVAARRFDEALRVWDDFFPRHEQGPRYRSWRWGAHVECFLLDTRRYRSPASAPVRSRTMLGREQLGWLIEGVTTSAAPFKLVFSSVPLDFGHGLDHWAGYRAERDHILDALANAGTTGVLFVSGDQHWFAAHVHRHGFRELQIGPVAAEVFAPPSPAPGVLLRLPERNFGLIDIGSDGLRFRAIGLGGRTLHDETFAAEDLAA